MSFQNIFTDGVLVDLNIRKWTAERALQPEDLGLRKDQLPATFHLGHKSLIPQEIIHSFTNIDYQARKLLTEMSFPFAFGNARFVPKKMFKEFTNELEKLQSKFLVMVEDLITNYEKYKLEVRPDYLKAAHSAYARFSKFNEDFEEDKNAFINAFLERVDSFYPDVTTLRNRFSINFVVFQMAMPDLSQAGIDDVVSEAGKAELIKSTYQEALYEKVQEYVGSLVGELRGKASTVLTLVRNNIRDGKKISEATLNMIKKMVDDYGRMDIIGDRIFYERLCSFRKKYIDPYNAKHLRSNTNLQKEMLPELIELVEIATNSTGIAAVADAYRQKIKL
jgi:hypothetical protein